MTCELHPGHISDCINTGNPLCFTKSLFTRLTKNYKTKSSVHQLVSNIHKVSIYFFCCFFSPPQIVFFFFNISFSSGWQATLHEWTRRYCLPKVPKYIYWRLCSVLIFQGSNQMKKWQWKMDCKRALLASGNATVVPGTLKFNDYKRKVTS